MSDIWFAGGCFWGTEKLYRSIEGVTSTEVGYANGDRDIIPTYEVVCGRRTGYRETVHVSYDPDKVSLDFLIYSFYRSIDPTLKDRQGNDYGQQYQACILWNDPDSESIVRRISNIEQRRYQPFSVVLEELSVFVPAEEYHQQYLEKNPGGYCHIEPELYRNISERRFDPADYKRPSDEEIMRILDPNDYWITQECGTEPPFKNIYDQEFRDGIYVDKVTGEPLFSSKDKYDAGSGWPTFSDTFDENAVIFLQYGDVPGPIMKLRSRVGNTHLGHVFYGDSRSPTGRRFCIDSASLRFIPLSEMKGCGYGKFEKYFL